MTVAKALELGAHRRGMDFDDNDVVLGLGVGGLDHPALPRTEDSGDVHGGFPV